MSRPAADTRVGAIAALGGWLLAALLAAACTKPSADVPPDSGKGPRAEITARVDGSDGADASAGDASASARRFDAAPYLEGSVLRAKSIGHTSVVVKVELSTGKKAAFKPGFREGGTRYRGEIAAYRLARALGLADGNVPAALPRRFARAELDAVLAQGDAGASLARRVLVDDAGRIPGALMPWIDGLAFAPLEAEPLFGTWRRWLAKDAPFEAGAAAAELGKLGVDDEPARRDLAAQMSTLVAFDYVTANWDRWSGGNVGWDRAKRRVLFVDNDGAFFETPPKDALARNQRLLDGVDRFSRALVERLRALGDEELTRLLGGDEEPLSANAIAGAAARRRALLAAVDARITKHGEAATLPFP